MNYANSEHALDSNHVNMNNTKEFWLTVRVKPVKPACKSEIPRQVVLSRLFMPMSTIIILPPFITPFLCFLFSIHNCLEKGAHDTRFTGSLLQQTIERIMSRVHSLE